MFKDIKKQFINILTQDKQIKLDMKYFEKSKLKETQNSTFLKSDDLCSKDLLTKLNIYQNNVPQTYISTLFSQNEHFLKENKEVDSQNEISVYLDENFSICVTKDSLENELEFYDRQIDYLISPFFILIKIIESKSIKNSLNAFIFDNKIYILLLDEHCKIKDGNSFKITPFEDVKNSNFYTDEVIGQKLYDEVYFLEIQQILSDSIESYYQKNSGADFIGNINIYYSIRQISDEQLDTLEESLVSNVTYQGISVSDYLYSFNLTGDITQKSFISSRQKKSNQHKTILWGGLAAASSIAAAWFMMTQVDDAQTLQNLPVAVSKNLTEQNSTGQVNQENMQKSASLFKLPNHRAVNDKVSQELMVTFDVIPFDAVLNEIEFDLNSTTVVASFIKNSSNIESLKLDFAKIYNSSDIILEDNNQATTNIIFSNKQTKSDKPNLIEYKTLEFLSITKSIDYLKRVLGEDAVLKFIKKEQTSYNSYLFDIKLLVNTPQEFFNVLEEFSKQEYSIRVLKPIRFSKLHDTIETKFLVELTQGKTSLKTLN